MVLTIALQIFCAFANYLFGNWNKNRIRLELIYELEMD